MAQAHPTVRYQVLAPDLPGAGLDRTPHVEATFASSVDSIFDLVDRAKEPVILVIFSRVGIMSLSDNQLVA